jgi:hypothetical protein
VATVEGLDRFRDFAIPTFSDQQGFSSGGIFSILTARDGSLWVGASDGLNRWIKGQITVYRYRSLAGVRGGSSSRLTVRRDGGICVRARLPHTFQPTAAAIQPRKVCADSAGAALTKCILEETAGES